MKTEANRKQPLADRSQGTGLWRWSTLNQELLRAPVARYQPRSLTAVSDSDFTLKLLLSYALCAFIAAAAIFLGVGYHGLFLDLNYAGALLGSELWSSLTVLGDTRIALAVLLFAVYRHPQLLPTALVACIPTALIIQIFKRTTEIARPSGFLDADSFFQTGQLLKAGSFPSGHSATAGVLFTCLILICNTRRNKLLFLGLLFFTALSRVMVGAHWPVDILVGSAIGVLCALFGFWLSGKFQLCSSTTSQRGVIALLIYAAISGTTTDSGYPEAYYSTVVLCVLALLTYSAHFLGFQPDRRWALGV